MCGVFCDRSDAVLQLLLSFFLLILETELGLKLAMFMTSIPSLVLLEAPCFILSSPGEAARFNSGSGRWVFSVGLLLLCCTAECTSPSERAKLTKRSDLSRLFETSRRNSEGGLLLTSPGDADWPACSGNCLWYGVDAPTEPNECFFLAGCAFSGRIGVDSLSSLTSPRDRLSLSAMEGISESVLSSVVGGVGVDEDSGLDDWSLARKRSKGLLACLGLCLVASPSLTV